MDISNNQAMNDLSHHLVPAEQGGAPLGIFLFWIPLGAGGSGFVRWNGRVYETLGARLDRRAPLDLYHTALEVRTPPDRFVIETMWPSPPGDPRTRGVVVRGPVFARALASTRVFRYEVRCWKDGVLPDAAYAVGGGRLISEDLTTASRLVSLVASVPQLIWGRDETAAGDMWNSNSVVSWLLASSGLTMTEIHPPRGGRAPGWDAGIARARRGELAAT